MDISFVKMHGLGNDFVIIDTRSKDINLTQSNIYHLADRRRGIGFDQLLILKPALAGGDVFLDIKNPDGSAAEACGNGARCVAALLMDEKKYTKITIETSSRVLSCARNKDKEITVNMGAAETDWNSIPLSTQCDTLNVRLDNSPLNECTCVNIGNPHAVFFCDNCEEIPIEEVGPIIENHAMFPNRTNVEFATIQSRKSIRMKVWERGAGQTAACGSGACAVLVAAVRRGLVERKANVILDGGVLDIEWTKDNSVLMKGPTTVSFQGILSV